MRSSADSLHLIRDSSPEIVVRAAPKPPSAYITSRRDAFVFASAPRSAAASRYREILDRILTLPGKNKLMLITSPSPGDGKTITSVNLAFALAERRKMVLLLELSLARPRFRYAFGVPPDRIGVEAVLRGEVEPRESIGQLGYTGIAIAGATSSAVDNALLAPSRHLDDLLEFSENTFDCTILDIPDVLSCPHAVTLAERADSVTLVIRSGQTQLSAMRQAIQTLGPHLNSVILNDA